MTMDADTIYPLYREYITCLHAALATLPSGPVSERWRVKRLTLLEFRIVWKHWGTIDGRQESWSARFSAGYEADAESIRGRIEAALENSETRCKAA